MTNLMKNFFRDDRGAAAVEYGLLAAAIAAVILLTVFYLGGYVEGSFMSACSAWKSESATSNASAFSHC